MRIPFDKIKKYLNLRYERNMRIPIFRQPSPQTCWAACYKMVDEWKGVTHGFCYYVRLQTHNCGSCGRPQGNCDSPRPPSSVTRDWHSLGYRRTRHFDTSLSLTQIRKAIKKRKPVEAYIRFRGKNRAHFFLITGTTRTYSADVALLIADPGRSGLVELDFSTLGQWGDWQQSWVIES